MASEAESLTAAEEPFRLEYMCLLTRGGTEFAGPRDVPFCLPRPPVVLVRKLYGVHHPGVGDGPLLVVCLAPATRRTCVYGICYLFSICVQFI